MRIEFSLIHSEATDCHSAVSVSVTERAHLLYVCCCVKAMCVEKKWVLSLSHSRSHTHTRTQTFLTITFQGIHLSWFSFVSEVTHKQGGGGWGAGAPFVAQNWYRQLCNKNVQNLQLCLRESSFCSWGSCCTEEITATLCLVARLICWAV